VASETESLSSSATGSNALWGNTAPNSGTVPNTGVTRHYSFVVKRGTYTPDGVHKSGAILVNGQSPGPLIEANWGDTISVTVANEVVNQGVEEGLSMRWHGIRQQGMPFYDGVPGVSQCPIAPGKTTTYTFRTDQFRMSWYHSHYESQYSDGAFGPIVIHGPLQQMSATTKTSVPLCSTTTIMPCMRL
jgi:FtsP/CotA-like multicopper oxidase with cupredoxin domain